MIRIIESGLENNNKYLRFYRTSLARKTNQQTNLEDCITRLWLRSDPTIWHSGPSNRSCSRCSLADHFTVSCPQKLQELHTASTLNEYYLSCLFLDWFEKNLHWLLSIKYVSFWKNSWNTGFIFFFIFIHFRVN